MPGLHNTFGIAARNFTAYPEMPDVRALVDYGVRMEETEKTASIARRSISRAVPA